MLEASEGFSAVINHLTGSYVDDTWLLDLFSLSIQLLFTAVVTPWTMYP